VTRRRRKQISNGSVRDIVVHGLVYARITAPFTRKIRINKSRIGRSSFENPVILTGNSKASPGPRSVRKMGFWTLYCNAERSYTCKVREFCDVDKNTSSVIRNKVQFSNKKFYINMSVNKSKAVAFNGKEHDIRLR
jgi:hypothetical protein